MEHHQKLMSLMKRAVTMMRESQEKRKEHREGKLSSAELNEFLVDYAEKLQEVQRQISEEIRKRGTDA